MPNNSNISEEDYLDSLLRAVSAGKDDFDIDDELGLDDDLDEQFEAAFEAELKAEFAKSEDVEIKEKTVKNTMAASNSVFTDEDDGLSEEERAFSTEIKNSVLSSVKKHEEEEEPAAEEPEAEKEPEVEEEPEPKKEEPIVEDDFPYEEVKNPEPVKADEPEKESVVKEDTVPTPEISEEDDITNQLAAMLGGMAERSPVKEEKITPTKEEMKAEKARIKANKKAAREAAKIAKKAEKAKKAAAKNVKSEDDELVNSMADIFDSANNDLRREYDANPAGRAMTAEEKSIDNSVDAALADLGLDALFNQIGQSMDETPEEAPAPREKRNFDDVDDPFADEEDAGVDNKKKKKEKKPKKKKAPKPKPVKKKKPPKPKKVKAPDEIIPISVPFLVFGLSLTALFVVAVAIGGNTYHYNTCMDRAVNYYVNKNYQAAYREISGLKIKEKDEFFYEQVKVVMTVESNYDMFKSMMRIGEYDEALDLLLKGVDNFDLYQNEAREWEAFDDLEVSLRRVVDALEKYYGITESQAREINLIDNQLEYSKKVAELAVNVDYDINEPFADETTTASEVTTGVSEDNTEEATEAATEQ